MAPLRSFEVSRRIAVSIDLDRTAARAWTKSFAPYFGVVEAVAPSLCMCLKGYCSPLTPLVELLLLGALRAFRSPIPWNVPGPLPSRRTAGERSFLSMPSFPWSAEDKLIPVILERCYVPFTSAKVVLFLGLFSPFHFHRFLNLFGMCELHLRTFAVAGDHGRKNFFLGVSSAFRQQVQRLWPRCTSDRLHRELVRELARRPLFFCQFVLVTLIQHSLDSSRSRRSARAGHGRWWERNERKQLDLHVHTRGESKDSSTTWLWQSVSAVRCANIAWLHLSVIWLPTSSEDSCFGKRVKIDTSDFVRRALVLQAAVDVTLVTAWEHSETLLFRPETRDVTISRRVESLWRSKLFAM